MLKLSHKYLLKLQFLSSCFLLLLLLFSVTYETGNSAFGTIALYCLFEFFAFPGLVDHKDRDAETVSDRASQKPRFALK